MISPISSELTVFFTVFFFTTSYVVGGGIGVLLRLLTGFHYTGSFWQHFVYNIALFIASVPILGFLLTSVNLFNPVGIYLLILFFGFLYLISILKGKGKKNLDNKIAKKLLNNRIAKKLLINRIAKKLLKKIPATNLPRPALITTVLFILILTVGLIIRLSPLIGEFVYPADDPHKYAFITQLLIQNKGYTFGLGYLDNYSIPVRTYPYVIGFPALNAIFALSTQVKVPLSTALVSQIGSALSILGVYFLGSNLFGEKTGLISGGVMAVVTVWPMSMFAWGGNLAYFIYFLLPISLVFLDKMFTRSDKRYAAPFGLMLAGTALIEPVGLWYLAPILIILLIYYSIKKKSLRPLVLVLLSLIIFFLLIIPSLSLFIHKEFLPGIQAKSIYSVTQSEGAYFQRGHRVIVRGQPTLSLNREFLDMMFAYWNPTKIHLTGSYYLSIYFFWLPILFISFYIYGKYKNHLHGIALLGAWILGMFVLSENTSMGLYLIHLPFYWVDPGRICYFMMVPLTILFSDAVYLIISNAAFSCSRFFRKFNIKKVISVAAVAVLIPSFIIGSSYAISNYNNMHTMKIRGMAVTTEDVMAFQWIKSYIPQGSVFLVNLADAGLWLREFADRPVLPDRQLLNDNEMMSIYELEELQYSGLVSSTALALLKRYNILYVYIGQESADLWSGRTRPSPQLLQKFHRTVYHHENVYIIKVDTRDISDYIVSEYHIDRRDIKKLELHHDFDRLTLKGPIRIELTLFHRDEIIESDIVKIDSGEIWSFYEYMDNRLSLKNKDTYIEIILLPEW